MRRRQPIPPPVLPRRSKMSRSHCELRHRAAHVARHVHPKNARKHADTDKADHRRPIRDAVTT